MLDLPAHRDMGRPWYLELATALKLQGELLQNAGSYRVLKSRWGENNIGFEGHVVEHGYSGFGVFYMFNVMLRRHWLWDQAFTKSTRLWGNSGEPWSLADSVPPQEYSPGEHNLNDVYTVVTVDSFPLPLGARST